MELELLKWYIFFTALDLKIIYSPVFEKNNCSYFTNATRFYQIKCVHEWIAIYYNDWICTVS